VDVREYLTADGKNPHREWLDTLDVTPRARIQTGSRRGIAATTRAGQWGLGSPGHVRTGVRIYFGKDGRQLVLLLLGGDKSTQATDVARAQES
jgi:putative addiction module killer protein